MLEVLLQTLDEVCGFRHSMMLVPDEGGRRLVAIASRGYDEPGRTGIGAEVDHRRGLHRDGGRRAEGAARVGGRGRAALRPRHPPAGGERRRRARTCARRSRCPACPTPRATWRCRWWCRIAWWGCWRWRAATRSRSAPGTRRCCRCWPTRSPSCWTATPAGTTTRPGTGREARGGGAPAAPPPCWPPVAAAVVHLLPQRRLRVRRRRVPDPQRAREDPVEAAERLPARRPHRVHQPGAAAGSRAGPAAGEEQPGEPADPAAPAAGGAVPRREAGPGPPGPLRAGGPAARWPSLERDTA